MRAPEIETVDEKDLWTPPEGSNNGVNKCWLNATLYTLLQNEHIRGKIIEHGKSEDDSIVFSKMIKKLIEDEEPWNDDTYKGIIEALQDPHDGFETGLIKDNPNAIDPFTGNLYEDREEFIKDLLKGKKTKDGVTRNLYYDALHTIDYIENVFKKMDINIYVQQTFPFGDMAEAMKMGPYVDCKKVGETGMHEHRVQEENEFTFWNGCSEISIEDKFTTKLIGLVQSFNIYSIDPITEQPVQGEAGHYRSFIPVRKINEEEMNPDFNANYEWVKKDALNSFKGKKEKPESGHFAHSYYIFLREPNPPKPPSGGGKRRVRTNKKRKGRRVNRTEKKNRRSIRKGNRRSRKKERTPKKRISNNERTPKKRVQRDEKTPKKRTLKKRR
jgi:hypothetical protein